MKSLTLTSLALAAAFAAPALAAPIAIGFTGALSGANFNTSNSGTLVGTSPVLGTAVFTPTQLTLTGSNAVSPDPGNFVSACSGASYGSPGPCQTTTSIFLEGLYSFDWSYLTGDGDGPAGDIFGVVVDSVRIQLSDPGGSMNQNSAASFYAKTSFAWFMNCTDCIGGSARATVGNVSVVPEPATLGLVGLGLLGAVGGTRRLRKAA